ncbi:MAG: adenosylcobinamide-GDP ribazoletransferase, partial [Dehalococcoidia bacterium]
LVPRPFLIALQFLTRLPIRLKEAPEERDIGRSMLYYPVIGLLIGVLLTALAWALADLPGLLASTILLAFWVSVTGALHLDGLADSADAWIGGADDRERTLAIMKDPHAGPTAVVVLVVVLLIKLAALEAVLAREDWMGLVLAPVLGRTALPLLFLTTPYLRPDGLGAELAQHLSPRAGVLVVLAASAAATGARGPWLLLATAGVFVFLRGLMVQRIGGITGDTAGALVELTETAVLVSLALA